LIFDQGVGMNRPSKWLAWTGPLFVLGFAVIVFGLEGSTPGEKASTQKIISYYGSHQGRVATAAFLAPLGAALLLLFAGYLRALARGTDGGGGVGPTVMVGGAVLWGAGILLGSFVDLSLVTAAHRHYDEMARTLNVLSNSDWVPFIGGIAVTLIGLGMTVLSSRILPTWLGWVALVGGILSLLGPGGFVGFFLAPLWLLVAGIMLGLRKEPAATAA
jgi:hypothetical protein